MSQRWDWASLAWLVWALSGAVFEVVMLALRRPQDSLSAQVWHLEGTGLTAARYAVAAGLLWLSVHLVFKVMR